MSADELDFWLSNRADLDPSVDLTSRLRALDRVLVTRTHLAVAKQPVSRHLDLVP
jgi:hypothetical protein